MAYVNSTRTVSSALADRMGDLLNSARHALHRRRVYTTTLNELNSLSDRDLSDLGLHRSTIAAVAREAAYGK
jgi:uncharacterized protein YjiS (DUF1127 family)